MRKSGGVMSTQYFPEESRPKEVDARHMQGSQQNCSFLTLSYNAARNEPLVDDGEF